MGGRIKFRLLLFGVQATGNDMKKKLIMFLCGELWMMCLGPLGYFFKLNENSKGPWISKNLSHSFIKGFKRKLWNGFWAQPLPLLQNHYPIQLLHKILSFIIGL
jgi:hypothetical protein